MSALSQREPWRLQDAIINESTIGRCENPNLAVKASDLKDLKSKSVNSDRLAKKQCLYRISYFLLDVSFFLILVSVAKMTSLHTSFAVARM